VPKQEISVPALVQFLQRRLPAYMVPTHFVTLERLPLTINGKVDRQALPAPERGRIGVDAAFAAPQSPVERKLAEIWAGVLKLEQVGIHDSFFDLGGDSITAIHVMLQVSRAFGVQLPPMALFAKPTIAGLASHIEEAVSVEIENMSDEEAERLVARLG
jgi:acyl carrier protein